MSLLGTDLREKIALWKETLLKYGMRMNLHKTKVTLIARDKKVLNIEVDGTRIEQVEKYEYLGVTLNESETEEMELNSRILNASKNFHSLNKGFISRKAASKETKVKVFKSSIVRSLPTAAKLGY